MSHDKGAENYRDAVEFYLRKEALRKEQARRPVSEDGRRCSPARFEEKLEGIRTANKAKRAAKEIKIKFKTR